MGSNYEKYERQWQYQLQREENRLSSSAEWYDNDAYNEDYDLLDLESYNTDNNNNTNNNNSNNNLDNGTNTQPTENNNNNNHHRIALTHEEKRIVRKLASRDYHLPGNTYQQDLHQFQINTHPTLGMCFAHPLHPLKLRDRILSLVGSIAFGLAAVNMVVVWFEWSNRDMNAVVWGCEVPIYGDDYDDDYYHHGISDSEDNDIYWNGGDEEQAAAAEAADGADYDTSTATSAATIRGGRGIIHITSGMLAMWTFGGAVHAGFDLAVWYVITCPCFHPGGFLERWGTKHGFKWGRHVAALIVLIASFLAVFASILRASVEFAKKKEEEAAAAEAAAAASVDDDDDYFNTNDDYDYGAGGVESSMQTGTNTQQDKLVVNKVRYYSFVIGYLVELPLVWFIYYPIGAFILFSGILGCYRLPRLGGRPWDIRREMAYQKRRSRKMAALAEESNRSSSAGDFLEQSSHSGSSGKALEQSSRSLMGTSLEQSSRTCAGEVGEENSHTSTKKWWKTSSRNPSGQLFEI